MGFQLLLDVCRIREWWMKPNGWLVSAGVWSADEVLRMLWIHFLISVLALFFESFQSRMVLLIACVFFLEKALYNWVEAEDFGGFFLHIYKEEWFPICGCPGGCVLLLESQGLVGIIESLFCVRLLKVFWLVVIGKASSL